MRAALIAIALTLAAGPALADPPAAEVEAFMANYIKLWNADDAQAITTQIYRFDTPGNPLQTIDGFQKSYTGLKAQGYDHSDTHSIHACIMNRTTALAEMRFARVKKDGSPIAPGTDNMASIYLLHKTADGWRVGAMIGMDASAKFDCKSFGGATAAK
jgi:ketosteroid isomerase-like protein